MLVFVDESGDSGFKLGRGSSTHFVVTAVCFSDRDAARACEVAIGEYRRANGLPERFEFHFSRTPAGISLGLLRTAAAFDFSFAAVAVEKAAAEPGSPRGTTFTSN